MAHHRLFIFLFLLEACSCGVKGRPLPPLNPAPIGYGEPDLKKETRKPNSKKNKESSLKQESVSGVTEGL